MKKISLILGLAFISNLSFSQEMKTLFNNDTTSKANSFGGYGGPFVGATQVSNELSIYVGAKGAMIKNHKLAIGIIGQGVIGTKAIDYNKYVLDTNNTRISTNVTTNKPTALDSTTSASKPITLGYGGMFIEYRFNYNSPVHFSIPVNVQVGGVSGGGDDDDLKIKSSFIFVVEPALNIEFNFYKFFIPTLSVGYRYVSGAYSSDLSGVYGGLIFKFGYF